MRDVLLRTVFAQAPDGIVVADREGRCIAVNPRFCELVGRPRKAVLSLALTDLVAPADVDPTYSTQTHVLPRQTCEEAGWVGTVGMIHSHPGGERCFYYFPGTEVASSDAASFARQPYPVDAIMCGDSLVWISRNRAQRQLRLADGPARMTLDHQLGNRVHTGTLAARGE